MEVEGVVMPSDRRDPIDEPFEIFSDNEVILTWRPAETPCDRERDAAEDPKAA